VHQVFISYREADKALAQDVAGRLESEGFVTWYYGRDSRVGFNYMEYIGELITECKAVVLLITEHSVTSHQVTREVMRACEEDKFVLPVLCGMDYIQFQKMQPIWRQALAGIAAIELPEAGFSSILPALVDGLRNKGIHPSPSSAPAAQVTQPAPPRIVFAYKRGAQPDEELLTILEQEFTRQGASTFVDRHLKPGMDWAREIEQQIRSSDVVIPLLSAASIGSEMLGLEVEIAKEAADQNHGKPYLVPVRVNLEGALPDPLGAILNPIQYALWKSPADNARLISELTHSVKNPPAKLLKHDTSDTHGAVALDSEYYIERDTDAVFLDALADRASIVLVKGPRQMGKTSLLARGLQQARSRGHKVVLTDFQKLNQDDLATIGTFFRALAELVADQLDLDLPSDKTWSAASGSNVNLTFERFIRREILNKLGQPLIWGMDEVDRLFSCPFANEAFGLWRSWHNARSLTPEGPWGNLTLAIVHATEPHLFIQDLNQSPFNVGVKIVLQDFTIHQVSELNQRYRSPLPDAPALQRYYDLLGGHPYLSRRGFQELSKPGITIESFEAEADRDEGPFGDHLRRMLVLLAKDTDLSAAIRGVLAGKPAMSRESFYRLRSSGVLAGDSSDEARLRCRLYANYLRRQML
jgi:hypothetical protein